MSSLYSLKNIEQYYEGRRVLNIPNLTINENQIVGFFGPNGSGKSTLFSILSFINNPSNGELIYKGIENKKLDLKTKQSVVMVPQNPYLLKRTVYENIAYGLKLRGEKENLDDKVFEALSVVGLSNSFAKRKWSQLSGGEAQRVALAARLILKPKVLILDEPTSGVDTNSAQLIKEAILTAKQDYNTTIFISSHDHNWLNHICDKKVALFQGNLIESSSVNLLFAPWSKNENQNLVKEFIDGQKLEIQNSFDKKRDSIAMINSDDITICRVDCEEFNSGNTLKGIIDSIHQINGGVKLLVQFAICGISFNCKITREYMQEQRLLPGDEVNININTQNVCWI
ncbi:hypothetical protein GCM10012288_13260 [Malaciobacter pacificus]|uniref:Tungsten ABC transporter TupABC, ATP-binding protein n=1 Tax=Malaciobacter pacificus TaxID=1080223 RepID=A0A5C2H5M5_9BACT|nr:energy-coupling factor ABC transporter ATP-binding protein [Malaciobacter pacificus]QEP34113.1 tungsten ABC transporter TupABC, ATP-binding protein [Malaciobacter pacificus]GGD40539.1 hypothetical protein GCM10012288_13260 [Malaciobacter pacificus]